ncbi:MAG: CoA pyrophosphatase [Anaerotignum sp.]|nr:CoA pyrophosphatase [Anaerotignum sp.]MBR5815823.1 CoA pyrophosphatase [Anaerotignum sp.]
MENLKKVTSIFAEHKEEPIWKLRFFAIMPLLTEIDGELHFILNKRAAGVNQPGDICFPGGHQEKGETLQETALRETEEEIGIPRDKIQVLGKSDFMLTVYRGMIQPFVGFVPYEIFKDAKPNPEEVELIFTVPLKFFLETEPDKHDTVWKVIESETFPYHRIEGGKNYPFSKGKTTQLFYEYDGHTIWGFTAQVIRNIVDILKENGIEK